MVINREALDLQRDNKTYLIKNRILEKLSGNRRERLFKYGIYCALAKIMKDKNVNIFYLSKHESTKKAFEYLGVIDSSIFDDINEYSDDELFIGFYRSCFDIFSGGGKSPALFYYIDKIKNDETVFLHTSPETLFFVIRNQPKFKISYSKIQREDMYRSSFDILQEEIRFGILRFLFEENLEFVKDEYPKKPFNLAIIQPYDSDTYEDDLYRFLAKLTDEQEVILLDKGVRSFHYRNRRDVLPKSIIEGRFVNAIFKTRTPSSLGFYVLTSRNDKIRLFELEKFYKYHSESQTDIDPKSIIESTDDAIYISPLSVSESNNDYASLFNIFLQRKKFASNDKLGNVASFRYASQVSNIEDKSGDSLSFALDRSHIDDHGGMCHIDDKNSYITLNRKKYKSSLIEDKEIYITRKTSIIKTGIFDESEYEFHIPQEIRDNAIPPVYVFASSIIVKAVKVPPYYLFAYLYYLVKNELIHSPSQSEKSKFFTIDDLEKYDIPILPQSQMESIASSFRDAYREYLSQINSTKASLDKMNQILEKFTN